MQLMDPLKDSQNLKKICVPKASQFLPALQSILRLFQLSGRSKEIQNDTLEGFRMFQILTERKQSFYNLFPLHDLISTTYLKAAVNKVLMFPKFLTFLHLPADLESVFFQFFS